MELFIIFLELSGPKKFFSNINIKQILYDNLQTV